MSVLTKIDDTQKDVELISVKQDNSQKTITKMCVKDAGTWKQFYPEIQSGVQISKYGDTEWSILGDYSTNKNESDQYILPASEPYLTISTNGTQANGFKTQQCRVTHDSPLPLSMMIESDLNGYTIAYGLLKIYSNCPFPIDTSVYDVSIMRLQLPGIATDVVISSIEFQDAVEYPRYQTLYYVNHPDFFEVVIGTQDADNGYFHLGAGDSTNLTLSSYGCWQPYSRVSSFMMNFDGTFNSDATVYLILSDEYGGLLWEGAYSSGVVIEIDTSITDFRSVDVQIGSSEEISITYMEVYKQINDNN